MRDPSDAACVFISHASRDVEVAGALCKAIEARGLCCWIANRNVDPGDNYQDSIVRAIERSRAMVLVFTQNANNSDEIKKEIALASQHVIPIIPVRIEDVMPVGAFRYELATRQWIDLFSDWEGAVEKIVGRIRGIAPGSVGETTSGKSYAVGIGRTRLPGRRSWTGWSAAAALGVAAVGIGAAAYFGSFHPTPQDEPAHYPETPEAKLNVFSFETSPQEYKAGRRRWRRVTSDRWVEEYADGTESVAQVLERIHVRDCDGTKVSRHISESFQVFLPDRTCPDMTLLFRRLPNRDWISYVQMEDVR